MNRFYCYVGLICTQLFLFAGFGNASVELACEWIINQQDPLTGLFRSYDMPGDLSAWTYDQAVGIISLLDCGDPNSEIRCADGMLAIAREPNQWVDGYDSTNQAEIAQSV
jgi:hypothetical protein